MIVIFLREVAILLFERRRALAVMSSYTETPSLRPRLYLAEKHEGVAGRLESEQHALKIQKQRAMVDC